MNAKLAARRPAATVESSKVSLKYNGSMETTASSEPNVTMYARSSTATCLNS